MTALLALTGLLAAAAPPTLAALELDAQQVPPAVAKLVGTQLTQRLTLKGFRVLTAADVAAVLGVERQKALLGCNDESSCIAEIGAALNARGVVLGSVGRLGETRLLNVKVVSSDNAQALAACSSKASSDEGLVSEAEACADTIALALLPRDETPRRTWALVPFIGGGVVALAGAAMLTGANLDAAELPKSTDQPPAVFARANADSGLATTGLVVLSVGAAIGVVGAVLYFTPPAPVTPVALVTPQGAFVGVSGVFR